MGYITKEGLRQLKIWKYGGGEYTWLDLKMNSFWYWCTDNILPIWMAPNLITMIGFFFMMATLALFVGFDATFVGDVPSWVFYFCAVSYFLYQTLDACDGKQARKTGASSPLGQLFDHGCDSVSFLAFFIAMGHIFRLSPWSLVLLSVFTKTIFFMNQWQEYHTGVINTNFGRVIGVTELQDTMIVSSTLVGIYGVDFFSFKVNLTSLCSTATAQTLIQWFIQNTPFAFAFQELQTA
jgi:phosphatidylglycerophosphate synthase